MAQQPSNRSNTVIDVSHWQGNNINWPRVKDAGKLVVMVKATQGTGTDSTWAINSAAALKAGLIVIPYLFVSNESAQSQVDHFATVVSLKAGMPVALDWEGNGAPAAATVEQVGLGLKTIIGRDPLGYWGMSPPGNPTNAMKAWPRWIPRYGVNNGSVDPTHPVNQPWLFWQYTSQATVDGIAGKVDASLFAGTAEQLIDWCNTGTLPP